MEKFQDLTGQKFGRLTVIKRIGNKGHNQFYLCKCDCGKEKVILKSSLISGRTKSCGCLKSHLLAERNRKYKLTGKMHKKNTTHNLSKTTIYKKYLGIKERCFNKNCEAYKYYGGRGITVCDEWKNNFQNFYDWAMSNGYKDDLTIERIDFNGNYCPANCKWIPRSEQTKNRRNVHKITYKGKTQSLSDWARELNISFNTLYQRVITSKWNITKSFEKPILKRNRVYKQAIKNEQWEV